MSHKSLLVFASVLCWDEDFDEIMLAATLFIIYFCNKISISYLFHCMLPCVRTVQILFWMYFLCLYLKQWVVSQALQGSWNTKTKWGDCHYSAASATGTLNIQTDVFMNFFTHFMVMGRIAKNTIFITLKLTESYEQSAGNMIDQCCRLNCVGKGVPLKVDNVSW